MLEETAQNKKKGFTLGDFAKLFLSIVKETFIFSLILYLVLFILETIFPGFVSYNFNLNWVLGGVLMLGLISAFAPPDSTEATSGKEDKDKPKITDYLIAVFLGLIGGILIFYKIQLDFTLKIIVSLVSAASIIGLSLILLLVKDDEVEEKEEEIETFIQGTFLSRKTFIYPIAFFRLLLFKKVNLPLILILMVFLFTVLALPQKTGTEPRKINLGKLTSLFKSVPAPEKAPTPSPTPTPTPTPSVEEEKLVKPSPKIVVKVLNGSREKEVAQNFVQLLGDSGFEKAFFGDAPNLNYENATIQFVPEDRDQVDLVANLLKESYSIINFAPPVSTKSGEITVILGNKVKY